MKRSALSMCRFLDEVEDAEVEVTDADIKAYIDDHKKTYTRDEETRQVSYVKYEVIPTSEDSAAIYADIQELVTPLQSQPMIPCFWIRITASTIRSTTPGKNLTR